MGGEEDAAGDGESQSEDVKNKQDSWDVRAKGGAWCAILIAAQDISAPS